MNVATCAKPAWYKASRAAAILRAGGFGATLMLAAQAAFAGAWTLPAGTGQAILSTTDSSNDRYFDNDGSQLTNQNYHKVETDLHIEYGITDSLTVFGGPSLLSTSADGPFGGHYFGPGYTDIGLRQRLYGDGTNVFSVQASARLPGATDSSNPAEIGYTGIEYDLRALYGRAFHIGNWPAFFNGELAWHPRNGAPPGEYRVDLTLGARPSADWLLLLQSFSVISDGRGTGVFDFAYRYYKIQPSVVWDFAPKWSLQLGAVATVAGRNSWREQGFTASLWRSF
jgi:protein XagA